MILAPVLLVTGITLARAALGSTADKLSGYAYEDTRRLVALVEEAAALMKQKGEAAFSEFGQKGSKWFTEPYYLFVYKPDGTCVFHPRLTLDVSQDSDLRFYAATAESAVEDVVFPG